MGIARDVALGLPPIELSSLAVANFSRRAHLLL
jgi:hypothetical protein